MNTFRVVVLSLCFVLCLAVVRAAEIKAPFADIDAYALAAPDTVAQDIPTLATYLAHPAKTDREKARVIFRWMSEHIRYDTDAFFSGKIPDMSAPAVLQRGSGVCEGYAALFEQLGKAMGLEVVIIHGFAKGYNFAAGSAVQPGNNHAWNAVRCAGAWQLVDVTWGSGYVDEKWQFVKKLCEHYFCTPPAMMIYDHFPEDQTWQLLTPPVTREAFTRYVFLRPTFFQCGLSLLSHSDTVITTESTVTVRLGAPTTTQLFARVVQQEQTLPDTLTFVQREGAELVVRALFPRAGDYLLRVFAKPASTPGAFNWALDYQVKVKTGVGADAGFPKIYSGFLQGGLVLVAPFTGTLPAGTPVTFTFTAPDADTILLTNGAQRIAFTKKDTTFSGVLTPTPGLVHICVHSPADGNEFQFQVVLEYQVKK